jgi:hypothetical protein
MILTLFYKYIRQSPLISWKCNGHHVLANYYPISIKLSIKDSTFVEYETIF